MKKLSVRDIDVSGKRVLVRVDFNVPQDENTGAITDDSRILATLPTIKFLIERGAKVIIAAHLGRPDGKAVDKYRLAVVAQRLSQLLGKQVGITMDCIGSETEKSIAVLKAGDVILLENLRFHSAEEKDSPVFARALARLADIYVNDAFSTSHRAHASMVGITKYLPAVAGLWLEKELDTLGGILENPAHPFGALIGGGKVSDKIEMLENLMAKVDFLLIGGAMAGTFLKAKSYEVGQSLVETDHLETAVKLLEKAEKNGVRLLLPVDVVVTEKVSPQAKGKVVSIDKIPPKERIVDIGPQTMRNFYEELRRCKMVFWNGPMGIYEIDQFAGGTRAMAKLLGSLKATTIVGGGSTAEVVTDMGLLDKIAFVSTGGGATLTFLGGQKMPALEALLDKDSAAASKLKGLALK